MTAIGTVHSHGDFIYSIFIEKYGRLVERLIPEIVLPTIPEGKVLFGSFTSLDNAEGKVYWVCGRHPTIENRKEILLEYSYYAEKLTMQVSIASKHTVVMNGPDFETVAAAQGLHNHETVQINLGPCTLREIDDTWNALDSITEHPAPIGSDNGYYREIDYVPMGNPYEYKG